jgi:Putative peptidoglycan binding domain
VSEVARIIIILVGVSLLLLATFGGDSSPATQSPSAARSASSILHECPQLKRGQSDPVDGKNCVRELQRVLHDLGYDQPLTGEFAKYTEANVKDFQRRHKIEAKGIVGPQTRAALLSDSSSSVPPIPDVPQSSYSTDLCTHQQCHLYLSRTATRRYAQLIAAHPVAAGGVSSAIFHGACARVSAPNIATVVCRIVAYHYAERSKNTLAAAARQHACLRITLRLPNTSQSPLAFDTDNSSRCKD